MILPNAHLARIDDEKLVGYCLNSAHEEGKHKARVFASALGITEAIYFVLRDEILSAVLQEEATLTREISYGVLWQVDFKMTYLNKSATVRTGWIIRNNEDFPRLTTCFVI